ncbi:hypothetical protein F511_22355 [Dorcoceras hygrometricum]|uniref:RING-type domain-containing protein n=1 Tax=Dorcoceras hygrometricum TaxID=472368 RepID=A0A2Z7DB83_9LAMI|nr:hypothetical protein F511_22355 [Dorcoceras hygrometricum]
MVLHHQGRNCAVATMSGGGAHLHQSHVPIPVKLSTGFLVATVSPPPQSHVYQYPYTAAWSPSSHIDAWNHPRQIIDGHLIIDLPDHCPYIAAWFSPSPEDDHMMETTFDKFPFYHEHSEEIDWCRPRDSWNMNQDYTYFNLFGCIVREDFTIHQLLESPEKFANGDLFPHIPEEFDYSKCDKICVLCGKDEHKERIAGLKCGHGYHVYCMQDWLHNWNICPLYSIWNTTHICFGFGVSYLSDSSIIVNVNVIIDGILIIDLPDHFSAEKDDHLMETTFDKFPFYQEHSDEIDWCRPRDSWNMNQDYTYFNLFDCIAREDFTIHQFLASPEEFEKEDLFPRVPEEFDYSKCDKI